MSEDNKVQSGRYSDALWAEIRRQWERAAGISYAAATQQAAIELNMAEADTPSKVAVGQRAKKEGWHREKACEVNDSATVAAKTRKPEKRVPPPAPSASASRKPAKPRTSAPPPAIEDDEEEDGEVEATGLTPREALFAAHFVVELNATKAAILAGYSVKSAAKLGSRLVNKSRVAAVIRQKQQHIAEKLEIDAEMVVQRYWRIATANPNELVQFRRECCRYCWGIDHEYQWTMREYANAVQRAEAEGETQPEATGGFDFDKTRDPHPECPECRGEGYGGMHIADTRRLSPDAMLLYAGMEMGKEGIKLKMHNQLDALDAVARHLGVFKDRIEVVNTDFSPEKLEELFAQSMAAARARTEAMRRDRESDDD